LSSYAGYLKSRSVNESKILGSSPDDLSQDFYLAANRAIDHYSSDKGAFKSYLDLWIKKVKCHETIKYVSLEEDMLADLTDDVEPYDIVNSEMEKKLIYELIALVDPKMFLVKILED
jgi:DNA-directed RNA polymerase specialized sigma24 family protein